MKKIKELFTSRKFRQGSVATAITAVVIAVIVLLNMLVTTLTDRYGLTLDLTANRIFNISEESLEFLSTLDKDVQIFVFNTESGFTAGGDYFIQANEVIKRYAQESPRVTVEYIDVVRNPTFTARFPELNVNTSSIVVSCGEKATDLTPYDLYNIETDQYTGSTRIVSSKAEQAMTSAMLNVTSDETIRVVLLTGHDESPAPGLRELLGVNNYEIIEQNLLTQELDPEAMFAVSNAPTRDFTEEELSRLDTFLYNGGQLGKKFIYFASDAAPETPLLDSFLADWGIKVNRSVVFETALDKMMNLNMFMPTVQYTDEKYSETVTERSLLTTVPYARPMEILYESDSYRSTSAALSFSETIGVVPEDADETWQPTPADVAGPLPALIVTTEQNYIGTDSITSHVVACAGALAVDQGLLTSPSLGNGDYFLSLFNVLAEREDVVYISPKTIGGQELGIQSNQVVILAVIFVVLLPLAVIVCGTVIWLRRRHK